VCVVSRELISLIERHRNATKDIFLICFKAEILRLGNSGNALHHLYNSIALLRSYIVVPLCECVISELREHMLMKHADRSSFSEQAERTHFLSLPLLPSLPLSLSLSLSALWLRRTTFHFEYRKQLFVSCLRFNRRPRRALLLSAEARPNVVSSQSAYSAFYSGYLTPPT